MVPFVDVIIPDSPSDFGAIMFWVLILILMIIVIIDIYTYFSYRKTSKKIEKPQQKLDAVEQRKTSGEDRLHDIVEIRKKVDKMIEINKL